ncbi:helix-turn-helix transcriptional regulator [Ketobacter sp.]|uniref:helix-turn-helix transcriptional regulator n=1 Tax=Ketobacter sp. TaxID=2083498 RepID=UPI0025C2EEF6|nr:helix-turn-helix transcriptional regulator [Ketobacter sp.]
MQANGRLPHPYQLLPDLTRISRGRLHCERYRTGIYVHTTDSLETEDRDVPLRRARCLTIGVLLEGELEFSLAGAHHHLQAGAGHGCRVFVIATPQPTTLLRHVRQGRNLRKVQVSLEPGWIEQQGGYCASLTRTLSDWLGCDNRAWHWDADETIVHLAQRILEPAAASPDLQQLQTEYFAVELLQAAAQAQQPERPTAGGGTTHPLDKARHYIEQHWQNCLSLNDIARQVGLSVSTLQRQFKATYGQTVVHFIRSQRLRHARTALEQQRISIGEAAFLAGYRHPSNFVTAYKREFGITPGASSH